MRAFWLLCVLAITPQSANHKSPLGSISGSIRESSRSGTPIPYASVAIVAAKLGALTDEEGRFRISGVPPGSHRVRIQSLGAVAIDTTIVVDSTEVRVAVVMRSRRQELEEVAARESLGVDVHLSSVKATCEIRAARVLHVGDHPQFETSIRNQGAGAFWLARSLDGSAGGRYPKVSLSITGPKGGFLPSRAILFCANRNSLVPDDFQLVEPGESFDPLQGGFGPLTLLGVFQEPGKYVVTFGYSTNETDIRKWIGWPQDSWSREVSQRFRGTPPLDLSASVEFEVLP